MRLAAFHSNYFINSQIRSVSMHRSYTARAMAKELVKGVDAAKLRSEKELIKGLKRINEATNQQNKRINKIPDYKLEALKQEKNSDYNDKIVSLLNSSSKLIQGNRASVFHEPGITNTKPNVAGITEMKKLHSGSKGFELTVRALAKRQITAFDPIKETESTNALQSGFKITVGGKEFEIKTKTGDEKSGQNKSNETIVKELADELNTLDIGIKAEIEKNPSGHLLKLSSLKTGADQSFKITAESGIMSNNKELQKASDAVYVINNGNYSKEYKASSNEVSINYYGVQLQLKEIGTTKFSFDGINREKLSRAMEDMINDYNVLSDKMKQNRKTKPDRPDIERKKEALHKIGIDYDRFNNKLSIDKKRQESAIEHNADEFKKIIGGREGLASKIKDYADKSLHQERKNHVFPLFNHSFNIKAAHDKAVNHSWSRNEPVLSQRNLYGFDRMFSYGSPMRHDFIQ